MGEGREHLDPPEGMTRARGRVRTAQRLCADDDVLRRGEGRTEEVVRRVYGADGGVEMGGGGVLYPLCGMRAGGGARGRMEMEQVARGKRIYLLDSELRGVPEGVVGEIYVGGEEQVWGYGGMERTAEQWVPDPRSGAGITAWVVRSKEGSRENGRFAEELQRGLKQELPGVMIPEKLVELEELPRTTAGEVDRGALLRQLEEEGVEREYVAAGTAEEEKLVQVWEQTLDKRPIGIHDNFFNIGGDSLLAVQVLARTAAVFQVEVPLRHLFESPTIAQMVPTMAQLKENPEEQTYATSSSLVPLHIVDGGENLFCFHAVKGGVSDFKGLIGLLPGVSIYGLQSEGMFRPIQYTTIESMAAYYVEIIRSVQKKGPYSLIGHSSGGHLAFEAAHILSRIGEKVATVILLDTFAPGFRPWHGSDLDLINFLALGNLDGNQEELSRLEGDEQLAYAFEQLKKLSPLPSSYTLDIARKVVTITKNNLTATNMYVPEPYGGHVALIAAEMSPIENIATWKSYVSGLLEVLPVAGGHTDLLVEPFIRQTAKHIQRSMGETNVELDSISK